MVRLASFALAELRRNSSDESYSISPLKTKILSLQLSGKTRDTLRAFFFIYNPEENKLNTFPVPLIVLRNIDQIRSSVGVSMYRDESITDRFHINKKYIGHDSNGFYFIPHNIARHERNTGTPKF